MAGCMYWLMEGCATVVDKTIWLNDNGIPVTQYYLGCAYFCGDGLCAR